MKTTLTTTQVLHPSVPAPIPAMCVAYGRDALGALNGTGVVGVLGGGLSHRAEIVPVPATGSFDGSGLSRAARAFDLRDDATGLSPRAAPV